MKRKRPTRDDAAARYRQALRSRDKAFRHLVLATSTLLLALNRKEPTQGGHQQTKSL